MQARVSHFAVPRERKPAAGLTSLQDMRKSHSSGYLNSLFNPSSNFNPYRGGSSYYSYYDSTFGKLTRLFCKKKSLSILISDFLLLQDNH